MTRLMKLKKIINLTIDDEGYSKKELFISILLMMIFPFFVIFSYFFMGSLLTLSFSIFWMFSWLLGAQPIFVSFIIDVYKKVSLQSKGNFE